MAMNGFSPAGTALGLNNLPGLGTALAGQTADEAEELRKKRLLELQQRQLLGRAGASAAASLFGGLGGALGGGFR
jgi:hypothetical protein